MKYNMTGNLQFAITQYELLYNKLRDPGTTVEEREQLREEIHALADKYLDNQKGANRMRKTYDGSKHVYKLEYLTDEDPYSVRVRFNLATNGMPGNTETFELCDVVVDRDNAIPESGYADKGQYWSESTWDGDKTASPRVNAERITPQQWAAVVADDVAEVIVRYEITFPDDLYDESLDALRDELRDYISKKLTRLFTVPAVEYAEKKLQEEIGF